MPEHDAELDSGIDEGRWRLAKALFAAAVRMEATSRSDWLDACCRDDPALRDLVSRLLDQDERDGDPIASTVRRAAHSTACRIQARAKRRSS